MKDLEILQSIHPPPVLAMLRSLNVMNRRPTFAHQPSTALYRFRRQPSTATYKEPLRWKPSTRKPATQIFRKRNNNEVDYPVTTQQEIVFPRHLLTNVKNPEIIRPVLHNNILLTGPDLPTSLTGIVKTFADDQIAISADIGAQTSLLR